jgi:hypothetical protein
MTGSADHDGFARGVELCDMPASAPSSVQNATTGFPLPALATNAVGMPAAPVVTLNPLLSR